MDDIAKNDIFHFHKEWIIDLPEDLEGCTVSFYKTDGRPELTEAVLVDEDNDPVDYEFEQDFEVGERLLLCPGDVEVEVVGFYPEKIEDVLYNKVLFMKVVKL